MTLYYIIIVTIVSYSLIVCHCNLCHYASFIIASVSQRASWVSSHSFVANILAIIIYSCYYYSLRQFCHCQCKLITNINSYQLASYDYNCQYSKTNNNNDYNDYNIIIMIIMIICFLAGELAARHRRVSQPAAAGDIYVHIYIYIHTCPVIYISI